MRFRTTYIESVLYEGDSIDDAVAAARKGVVGWRARGGLISVQFSRSVKRDACYDVDMDTDGRHFVCAGEIDWMMMLTEQPTRGDADGAVPLDRKPDRDGIH